jgi:hypothetical protein
MARIRTIKPEFFTSEDIVALEPLTRLLYIAIWLEADREGRLLWKPKTFKMRYFPADDCDIECMCDSIVRAGLVVRYGEGCAYVPKFGQHQHINPRETQSSLPDPHASGTRQSRVGTRQKRDSDVQGGREGREGIDARVDDDDVPAASAPPPVVQIPLVDGSEFDVLPSKVAEWSVAFPAVDVPQKLRQMRTWCVANPTRRKTRRGVEAFIVKWLGNDQDSGRNKGSTNGTDVPWAGAI